MKISQRIRAGLQEGEDILTSLLGLIIAISGLIAFADVFSNGRALAYVPWLLWVWIVLQAIAIDYMFYVSAKRQFTAKNVEPLVYWIRWVLIVTLGALVVFVGAIFAVNETQGGAISASMQALGIPAMVFMYARAVSPVLLLFVIAVDHTLARKAQSVVPPAVPEPVAVESIIETVLEQLDARYQQRFETAIETVRVTVEKSITQNRLLALPKPPVSIETPAKTGVDTEQRIRDILTETPGISIRKLAEQAGCAPNTAQAWKKRIAVKGE